MFLLQNCLKRLISSYFVKNPVSHLFVVVGAKIKQEKRKTILETNSKNSRQGRSQLSFAYHACWSFPTIIIAQHTYT
jgi:hypothetical protein